MSSFRTIELTLLDDRKPKARRKSCADAMTGISIVPDWLNSSSLNVAPAENAGRLQAVPVPAKEAATRLTLLVHVGIVMCVARAMMDIECVVRYWNRPARIQGFQAMVVNIMRRV